jgi:hypothetical protein
MATSEREQGIPLEAYLHGMRLASDACWRDLPPVIHAAFECAKCANIDEILASFGVHECVDRVEPEQIYTSDREVAIFAVWHDTIEREPDGSLAHWIDTFALPAPKRLAQPDRTHPLLPQLQKHAGREAHVLWLKRGWDAQAASMVEAAAPDVAMWRLEAAGQQWFALRRPLRRRRDRQGARRARVG